MSYERRTIVSGKTTQGEQVFASLAGHWKIVSALRWARRANATGPVRIELAVYDMSGRGRSGHEGVFVASENLIEKIRGPR